MNQFTLFIKTALLSAFLVAGLTASAQTVVFSDNFSDLSQGTFSNTDSTGMSNYFPSSRKGWNTAKSSQVYYGATVVRIGARKAPGVLQTDTMNLAGNFQLTFKGYAWAYDANSMDILLNGKLLQTVTLPNGPISTVSDLLDYTITGTGTGKDVIAFVCKYQSNRILVTNIVFTTVPATATLPIFAGNTKAPFAQNGVLFIQTQTAQPVAIYSATGTMVRSLMSNAGTNTVSLSQGLYLVKIGDKVYKVVVN
jgi:hypothetical protein